MLLKRGSVSRMEEEMACHDLIKSFQYVETIQKQIGGRQVYPFL